MEAPAMSTPLQVEKNPAFQTDNVTAGGTQAERVRLALASSPEAVRRVLETAIEGG